MFNLCTFLVYLGGHSVAQKRASHPNSDCITIFNLICQTAPFLIYALAMPNGNLELLLNIALTNTIVVFLLHCGVPSELSILLGRFVEKLYPVQSHYTDKEL